MPEGATGLEGFFDPGAYHPDALAAERASKLSELSTDLALVRLCGAFDQGDLAETRAVLAHITAKGAVGYQLFLVRTAELHLALLEKGDAPAALDQWLNGWHTYPANWNAAVLDAPGVKPLAARLPPERLKAPVIEAPKLSKADRAFVKGLKTAIRTAIKDNLEWLRTWEPDASPVAIAAQYQLAYVNRDLNEATISAPNSANDLPDIILACDEAGKVTGSFIAH